MTKRRQPKVHLWALNARRVACGLAANDVARTTQTVSEATCQSCATALARANNRRR